MIDVLRGLLVLAEREEWSALEEEAGCFIAEYGAELLEMIVYADPGESKDGD